MGKLQFVMTFFSFKLKNKEPGVLLTKKYGIYPGSKETLVLPRFFEIYLMGKNNSPLIIII